MERRFFAISRQALHQKYAQILRSRRINLGLSIRALAEAIGYKQSTWRDKETGAIKLYPEDAMIADDYLSRIEAAGGCERKKCSAQQVSELRAWRMKIRVFCSHVAKALNMPLSTWSQKELGNIPMFVDEYQKAKDFLGKCERWEI